MVKVGAIIQVRLGSERLPGKALLPLPFSGGPSLLEHVVARAEAAHTLQEVVVATTVNPADDTLADFCARRELTCFRGAADDVLDRYLQAALANRLDVIVRLTGDNPFVMPQTIDQAVEHLLMKKADYTITTGLPLGTNVEVFTRSALEKAATAATEAADREHVTSFIRRESGFNAQTLALTSPIPHLRLTVDFPSDYALASMFFERLQHLNSIIGHEDIASLLGQCPWLSEVNAANAQRKVFASEEDEITEARRILQAGGLSRVLLKL